MRRATMVRFAIVLSVSSVGWFGTSTRTDRQTHGQTHRQVDNSTAANKFYFIADWCVMVRTT